jgi:predicted transcriptional regulator
LIEDLMRSDVLPLQLNDSVDRAMELFVENDLLELPVVDESTQNRVIGVVSRSEISSTYLRHVQGALGHARKGGVHRRTPL